MVIVRFDFFKHLNYLSELVDNKHQNRFTNGFQFVPVFEPHSDRAESFLVLVLARSELGDLSVELSLDLDLELDFLNLLLEYRSGDLGTDWIVLVLDVLLHLRLCFFMLFAITRFWWSNCGNKSKMKNKTVDVKVKC